jgi:hypothetical protein
MTTSWNARLTLKQQETLPAKLAVMRAIGAHLYSSLI